ncbi:protein NUCLEAR FUSION DEFECTIVE 4 [Rhodamnia argentea]|uniref:Protein NUCLEAR FUSION DEFECTIVE 4 n=1 Tax=Rhodamnia argentea TaxID=178133 RepID=A0A8B8NPG8_9MYRT|nr:protein NUCLEAR FUSION DEFECTIVE 4 [Rhodamnia argentea]
MQEWLSVVAMIWLQSVAGTNANFPAYSSQLKQILSISQVQLNNLAFASDAGKLLGWFSGLAAVYLPLWLVLLIGTSLGLVGYGVQYLFVAGRVASLSYPAVFLLTALAGNSICWINTACYVVAIRSFPLHRQVVVGLTTSYQGLSASVYTDIVDTAFNRRGGVAGARAYLLLSSVVPMATSLVTAPFVRDANAGAGRKAQGGFMILFMITIATGVYAVVSSMGSVSGWLPAVNNAMGMGILLAVPAVVPLAEGLKHFVALAQKRVHDAVSLEENGEHSRDKSELKLEAHRRVGNQEEEVIVVAPCEEMAINIGAREELGVGAMVRRVEFWLYFFVYLLGATIGLVFLNNLGQIAESRGCSNAPSLVALSSSFGFFGRLIPSLFDCLLARRKYMVARPASIAGLMAPMVGAYFLLLSPAMAALYTSTAVIGICTGAITSIAVATTTELFGTENFSVNHNIVVANIPIGSFVFGYAAALLYRRRSPGGSEKCMGTECYGTTFIIWGCLCLLGTVLALVLYARTRKFYSRV